MTDFFDDLERQLVEAAPQRAARLRRARAKRAAAVASILVALLVGGAGIAAAVGGDQQDGGHGAPASQGGAATTTALPAAPPAASTTTTPADRAAYEVAILNATTVPGLARGVANRLQNDRFKIGNVTNAAEQDRTETVVYYRTPDCVPAATDVASALRLGDANGNFALRTAPRGVRAIAGPDAKVIVVVGSDQNTHVAGP
jgi:LytR cell envelope-related transcriptional attenuator